MIQRPSHLATVLRVFKNQNMFSDHNFEGGEGGEKYKIRNRRETKQCALFQPLCRSPGACGWRRAFLGIQEGLNSARWKGCFHGQRGLETRRLLHTASCHARPLPAHARTGTLPLQAGELALV